MESLVYYKMLIGWDCRVWSSNKNWRLRGLAHAVARKKKLNHFNRAKIRLFSRNEYFQAYILLKKVENTWKVFDWVSSKYVNKSKNQVREKKMRRIIEISSSIWSYQNGFSLSWMPSLPNALISHENAFDRVFFTWNEENEIRKKGKSPNFYFA